QGRVGLGRGLLERLQPLHDLLDLLRSGFERVLRFLHLEALALLLLLDRGQLGTNRPTALLRLLRALRELQGLDFEVVALLASERQLLALVPRLLLRLPEPLLEGLEARFGIAPRAAALGHLRRELLDLALAREHAVQLRLRPVEDHALAAEE